jgi:hypothetical protein
MALSFIQAAQSVQGNLSVAFSSNNAAGNTLVAISGNETATITGISDTAGNTGWTALPQQNNGSHSSQAFYCLNCKAGANTVSFTVSSTSVPQIAVAEYSGVLGVDTTAQAVVAQGASAGASVTTTHPNTIVIGLFDDNDATYGAGTGWTSRTNGLQGTVRTMIVDAAFTSVGTYAPGFTKSPVNGATESNTIAFFGSSAYSVPDSRNYGTFPNLNRNVQGTLTYDVPSVFSLRWWFDTLFNRTKPLPLDTRTVVPADSRNSGIIPQNTRSFPPF